MTSLYDFSELAELININSYTKNKAGVDEVASRYTSHMEAIGYGTETYFREHIGNHTLYVSKKRAGKKLLLLGHFDTVFPEGTFVDFNEDDEWIYGPGVCDMKGGNHVALESLRNIANQNHTIYNIDVLMVSDEESGSDDSKQLTQHLAPQYDYCMVFEAAGPNQDIVIARKGIATFHIEISGKAAHAGNHYSEGVNANLVAAHLLINLTQLTNLDKGTTVNAGKLRGGIGANTISPSASLTVEARFTEQAERDRILRAFSELCVSPAFNGAHIDVSGGLQRDVMSPSQAQSDFIEQIESITQTTLVLEKRGGVSDANVVSGVGVATLDGFGPYGDGDHTIHERASKQSFIERIELVTKILAYFQ